MAQMGIMDDYQGCSFAGTNFPCFDCKYVVKDCGEKIDVQRRVFFAISSKKVVSCREYEQARYHGVEGCQA